MVPYQDLGQPWVFFHILLYRTIPEHWTTLSILPYSAVQDITRTLDNLEYYSLFCCTGSYQSLGQPWVFFPILLYRKIPLILTVYLSFMFYLTVIVFFSYKFLWFVHLPSPVIYLVIWQPVYRFLKQSIFINFIQKSFHNLLVRCSVHSCPPWCFFICVPLQLFAPLSLLVYLCMLTCMCALQ